MLNVLSGLSQATEFWSAIIGAIVGGVIALVIQLVALRASKKQREEDRLYVQRALASSLVFKVTRIHSNNYGIHHHIETCYETGKQHGDESNPWRFFVPLANPPEPVVFSSDELGLLFAQKNNEVFNSILDMDVAHNSLIEVIKLIAITRKDLTGRLKVGAVEGTKLSGVFSQAELLAIQPQVLEVNSLIEHARRQATDDYNHSLTGIDKLSELINAKLGLGFKIDVVKKM